MDLCCLCRRKTHRRLPDKHDHSESRDTASCPLPQELLDECMSYLNYNSTDLKVCALVCRSWSAAAQRLLFNVVVVTAPPRRYSRIEQTLRTSPHLIQYIHTLVLHRNSDVKINVFEKFCTLPFTHVENISISHSCTVTLPSAIAFATAALLARSPSGGHRVRIRRKGGLFRDVEWLLSHNSTSTFAFLRPYASSCIPYSTSILRTRRTRVTEARRVDKCRCVASARPLSFRLLAACRVDPRNPRIAP
ncbi:hypothetical protein B0H14DRAFT_1310087 [Mycena olivaceomarginata]|nr:hypothetical protein B0H14DRAFT_1310087 [Mycena olivaceomarginata]